MIPFSVKTVVNTVGWGWLQTFQSSSSTSCHLSKGHIWLACKHPVSKFHSCFERYGKTETLYPSNSDKVWFKKKKKKEKGGSLMIICYKMTCFHPCYILPWYVTVSIPAFFCPPFCFWQEKTGDMKHFPIFFLFFLSLTSLVKTCRREEVCHFSSTAQPTKYNSFSALERSPFPQRPKKQKQQQSLRFQK